MNILALDAANFCGYAHSNGVSGVWEYKKKKTDSPGAKWLMFIARLRAFLKQHPTDKIVYEQAHHRGGAATHSGHGYIACIEYVASSKGITVGSAHSATIKKHATGSGRASKDQMMEACIEKLGITPMDDNEADALWILNLAISEEEGED